MHTIFIVLVYNKDIFESQSLKSLLIQKENIPQKSEIVIFNNGVNIFKQEDKIKFIQDLFDFSSVSFIHGGKNESLARIYNRIICDYDAKKYVLLDDDTELNEEFLHNSQLNNALIMPKIKSKNIEIYPFRRSYRANTFKFITISSGLCISSDLLSKVKVKYGDCFDERFKLYGVDTSFCLRLCKLDKFSFSIKGALDHSLSKFEKETTNIKNFRYRERAIADALILRNYISFYSLINTLKFLIKLGVYRRFYEIKLWLTTYVKNKHPDL
jgi:GT2 family glycosyltransferase